MSMLWPQRRLLRIAVVSAAGLVLLAVAGTLAAPSLLRWQLVRQLSRLTHRPVAVESVAVLPFRLAATVRGLSIGERDGSADALRIEELFVNLSSASFYRFAPVLDELTVTRPALGVIRFPDRKYNWQDLVEEYVLAPSEGPPPRFAVYNIRVRDGSIRFDDRVVGRQHEVAALTVGIPFLSNLPSAIDVQVKPELSGRANGTPFALQGDTKPFKDTLETTLELKFEALPLPEYLDYSPVALPFALPSGKLDTDLTLVFEAAPGNAALAPARLLLRGTAALSGVAIDLPPGRRLASFARLAVDLEEADPLAPSLAVRSIRLERPEATIVRRPDGTLNLQDALPALPAPLAQRGRDAGSGRPLAFSVGELAVTDGSLRLRDDVPARPFITDLANVTLTVRGLGTAPGTEARVESSFTTDAEGTFAQTGTLTLDPLASRGEVRLTGFRLQRLYPYYADLLNVEVTAGTLDAATGYAAALRDGALEVKAEAIRGTVRDAVIEMPGEPQPLLRLARAEIAGGTADLATRTVALEEVRAAGAAAYVRRDRDGTVHVTRILKPLPAGEPAPAGAGAPWRIGVARLVGSEIALAFDDRMPEPPVTTWLARASADLAGISNEARRPIRARLRGRVAAGPGRAEGGAPAAAPAGTPGGDVAYDGTLWLTPLAADGSAEVRQLPLPPFEPYLDPHVRLTLTGGLATAKGTVRAAVAAAPAGPLSAQYRGTLLVSDLTALDEVSSERLVEVKSLYLGGLAAQLEPIQVGVDEVALSDFYLRAVLDEDGTLNIWRALSTGDAPETVPLSADTPEMGSAQVPRFLRFGQVTIAGGHLDATDHFVKPNYSATITGITGTVTEMTPERPAELDLSAKLDGVAPVTIRGPLNALSPRLYADIAATAREIELPPFSPYMIKYGGYGIAKGKLSADVRYQVQEGKLEAQNHVVIDQLTLGEKVDSPTATKLPVRLGIALLKDKNGVIDVDIPLTGSLDDPQFRVWPLIWKMVGNLMTKA
nr:DUF748 domain-containing protein [Acidobacteriota bacterium]